MRRRLPQPAVEQGTPPAHSGGRPARVAVVTPYYPPHVGGLERYTAALAQALRASDDLDVVVVTTAPRGRRPVTTTEDGVVVVRLPTWFTLSNTPVNPWWAVQLRSVLRRHRIDVVHAHTPTPFMVDVAARAAGGRPLVVTSHSGSMVKGTGGVADLLVRTYERWVEPATFARADRLIGVSPVAAAGNPGVAIVPPGVDSSRFVPPQRRSSLDVTYVGRMQRTSRWKGVHVLLDAFHVVLRHEPRARLVLVGDGDDVAQLRAQAERLGISESVVWRGSVSGDELVEAYQQAAVVVLPSLTESESFGMTLVEAMACGTPVVGSRVGGIPYVIRDGTDGLLVPPGDPDRLGKALVTLLGDAELGSRLGAAGREAAVARWDWKHSMAQNLAILRAASATRR